MPDIANRLKDARGTIPRKDVCKAIGISLNTLMMYENGKRVPRDGIKIKLARFYNKSIEDLFFAEK